MIPNANFRSTDIAVGYPVFPVREVAAPGSAPSNASVVRTFDQDGMHTTAATRPVPAMPTSVQRTIIGGSAAPERRGTVIISSSGDNISFGDPSSGRHAGSSDYKNGSPSDGLIGSGDSDGSQSSVICSEPATSGDWSASGSNSGGSDSGGSDGSGSDIGGGCVIS